MPQLNQLVNKEIFLSYDEDDNDAYQSEIYVTEEFMELTEHMGTLSTQMDSSTKVLHGVLTKAHTIPENLRGKRAFIIIESSNTGNYALIIDTDIASSSKELAKTVSTSLSDRSHFEDDLDIEKVYILYGYEITTILSIDEEDMDEEIIDTCKKIAKDACNISSVS